MYSSYVNFYFPTITISTEFQRKAFLKRVLESTSTHEPIYDLDYLCILMCIGNIFTLRLLIHEMELSSSKLIQIDM